VKIEVRNGKVDQALRKFKRKIADDNKLFDYKEKEFFEKPRRAWACVYTTTPSNYKKFFSGRFI